MNVQFLTFTKIMYILTNIPLIFFKFQVVLKNKHASLTEFLLYKEGQSQNHLPIGIQKLHNILLKKTASVLIHYNSR